MSVIADECEPKRFFFSTAPRIMMFSRQMSNRDQISLGQFANAVNSAAAQLEQSSFSASFGGELDGKSSYGGQPTNLPPRLRHRP